MTAETTINVSSDGDVINVTEHSVDAVDEYGVSDYLPVIISSALFLVIFVIVFILYCCLIKRSENYYLNLRAMIGEGKIHGMGDTSREDCLRGESPAVYMSQHVIPKVETRTKTENALLFTKQKYDPRSALDVKKIRTLRNSRRFAATKKAVRWKVPRIVIANEKFVEMSRTSKPQLKAGGKKGRKDDDEDLDQDTLSKGPPVLDMYVDDVSDEVYFTRQRKDKEKEKEKEMKGSEGEHNSSGHLSSSSEGANTDDQLVPGREEALQLLGRGSGGKRRSFVSAEVNKSLPSSGPTPERANIGRRTSFFS